MSRVVEFIGSADRNIYQLKSRLGKARMWASARSKRVKVCVCVRERVCVRDKIVPEKEREGRKWGISSVLQSSTRKALFSPEGDRETEIDGPPCMVRSCSS